MCHFLIVVDETLTLKMGMTVGSALTKARTDLEQLLSLMQQSWRGSLVFDFYLDRVRAEGFQKELLNSPLKNRR